MEASRPKGQQQNPGCRHQNRAYTHDPNHSTTVTVVHSDCLAHFKPLGCRIRIQIHPAKRYGNLPQASGSGYPGINDLYSSYFDHQDQVSAWVAQCGQAHVGLVTAGPGSFRKLCVSHAWAVRWINAQHHILKLDCPPSLFCKSMIRWSSGS